MKRLLTLASLLTFGAAVALAITASGQTSLAVPGSRAEYLALTADPNELRHHELNSDPSLPLPAEWPGTGVSAKTVFAPDGRNLVVDSRAAGWRTVSVLLLYDSTNTFVGHCSGVMLADNVVLTAAHCLYAGGEWIGSVGVAPGSTAAGPTYGVSYAYDMAIPKGWAGGEGALGDDEPHAPSPFDYGLVFLEGRPFGSQLGPYLALASAPDSYFEYIPRIATAGFPGDRPFGSMWTATSDEFFLDETYLYTRLDIFPGQSGSPIWSLGADGVGFIFSVVSGGNANANRSVRFTPAIVQNLSEACAENNCTIRAEDFTTYQLAGAWLCRTTPTCQGGNQPLVAGQPIRMAFQLSKLAVEPIRAVVFWNGVYAFALDWPPPPPPGSGTFYITDPGLPPPPGPGTLRVEVWVGSTKAGTFEAVVPGAPTATATVAPTATPTPKPAPLPTMKYRLKAMQLARDGVY